MMADENNTQDAPAVDNAGATPTPSTEPTVAAETQSQDSGDATPQREQRGRGAFALGAGHADGVGDDAVLAGMAGDPQRGAADEAGA